MYEGTPTTQEQYHAKWPKDILSYGGGRHGTGLLVLAARGIVSFDALIYANVGEDSENPETLRYLREYAMPYAQEHGLRLIEVKRAGESLYTHLTRPGNTYAGIPMFHPSGSRAKRACTVSYKIDVVDDYIYTHEGIGQKLLEERAYIRDVTRICVQKGYDRKQIKEIATRRYHERHYPLAIVSLGIALDEFQRANNRCSQPWKAMKYPLIDLRLTTEDCERIIAEEGLPVPPPSRCWFCPYQPIASWQDLQRNDPERFEEIAFFEDRFNQNRRSKLWFTRKCIPLREAVQPTLLQEEEDNDNCEYGYCWT